VCVTDSIPDWMDVMTSSADSRHPIQPKSISLRRERNIKRDRETCSAMFVRLCDALNIVQMSVLRDGFEPACLGMRAIERFTHQDWRRHEPSCSKVAPENCEEGLTTRPQRRLEPVSAHGTRTPVP